jgi:hypothetical protein
MITAKSCTIVSEIIPDEPLGDNIWGREEVDEWFIGYIESIMLNKLTILSNGIYQRGIPPAVFTNTFLIVSLSIGPVCHKKGKDGCNLTINFFK